MRFRWDHSIFSHIDIIPRLEIGQNGQSEVFSDQSWARSSGLVWAGGSTTRQRMVIDPPRRHRGGARKVEGPSVTREPVEGGAPSAVAIRWPSLRSLHSARGFEGVADTSSTVCAATVVTVLNYPHFDGSYERDDSNARARCNEERITDGFVPFSAECAHVIFCVISFR